MPAPADTPERPSDGHADRPALVLVLDESVGPVDLPALCAYLRQRLVETDADQVVCEVRGLRRPTITTLDILARLQLTARRLGCQLRLRHPDPRLRALLELAGLSDVIPSTPP